MINVLITSVSRRVALVKNFKKAIGGKGRVITIDCDPLVPGLYFSDKKYKAPLVESPDYLPAIREILEKEKINLIIPTIDPELELWSKNKENFKRLGAYVSISPIETIRICGDKWETFRFFKSHGFPFADTYLPETLKPTRPYPDSFAKINGITQENLALGYPLFVKPRKGRGSVDSYKVGDSRDLYFYLSKIEDQSPVVMEYLEGKEFTVDAFFSRKGELIQCVPRYRLVIRAGVSDRGETFQNTELVAWIKKISKALRFEGAVNFQGKIKDGKIKFFEINPRFSGGIQLCMAAVNKSFAELLIKELNGEILEPDMKFKAGIVMSSFEDSVFYEK